MATKAHDVHVCSACGHSSHRWFGRCPECGEWSSALAPAPGGDPGGGLTVTSLAGPLAVPERIATGVGEVDRVLGGGLVAGSVTLLAGEPGIGKSTLVLQVMGSLAARGTSSFLITGEESLDQVGLRAKRLGIAGERLQVAAGTTLGPILAASAGQSPDLLIIDSVQTLQDASLEQSAGSVTQVRECSARLIRYAKETGIAVLLVGHVTKDGSVAGPKTLEHMVDTVLTLEGERTGSMRLLRSTKNRFGSCEETGVFTMAGCGLQPVSDPSAMLLADRRPGVLGSVVFPGLEGTRPVLVELQALVTESTLPQPRRVAIGLEARRMALLLAVIAQHNGLTLPKQDVFVAAAGGMDVREPAADLALCLALFSAISAKAVPDGMVAFGEVGLAGEVRRVPGADRRLSEAARMGFEVALAPKGSGSRPRGLQVLETGDLLAAFKHFSGRARGNGEPSVPRADISKRVKEENAVVSLGSKQR
jgi:DNA repair protein RadA/Sms